MLHKRLRITCLIRAGVSLDDMSVRLGGLGASEVVLASTADRSSDLADARRNGWVKTSPVSVVPPVWPVLPRGAGLRPEPPPSPGPRPGEAPATLRTGADPAGERTLKILSSIDEKLGKLLARPSAALPEVIAAAVKGISSKPGIPAGLPGGPRIPGPGVESHPQFISSQIVPTEGVEARVKTYKMEVDYDVDEAVQALKKLRKKP